MEWKKKKKFGLRNHLCWCITNYIACAILYIFMLMIGYIDLYTVSNSNRKKPKHLNKCTEKKSYSKCVVQSLRLKTVKMKRKKIVRKKVWVHSFYMLDGIFTVSREREQNEEKLCIYENQNIIYVECEYIHWVDATDQRNQFYLHNSSMAVLSSLLLFFDIVKQLLRNNLFISPNVVYYIRYSIFDWAKNKLPMAT